MKQFLTALCLMAFAIFAAPNTAQACWGCSDGAGSDVETQKQLEGLLAQSNKVAGMPSITNFFEKRMVRMLYELRDNPAYITHTYIMTINGDFVWICDSIGFGINASIQYSNPVKLVQDVDLGAHAGVKTLPQAEPNALFMPEGLAATYVVCVDDGAMKPVYMEPEIIVSPFRYASINVQPADESENTGASE